MAYSPTELLTIYLDAQNQRRKVGRLAFKDRRVLFEYDASFIASEIEISPIKPPRATRPRWVPGARGATGGPLLVVFRWPGGRPPRCWPARSCTRSQLHD